MKVALLLCAALVTALPGLAWPGPAGATKWQLAKQGSGVKVWMMESPGRPLAVIRARTRVSATTLEVLAVINDVNKSCAWAGRCLEARVLHRDGPKTRLYSRRAAPWPVSDRDFELLAVTRALDGERLLRIDFKQAARARTPLRDGVVRMPLMRGHYELRRAPGGATDVELQIEADPGGWIPKWIVRWTARNGPFASLAGLRKRVPKVRQRYKAEVENMRARLKLAAQKSQAPAVKAAPARP